MKMNVKCPTKIKYQTYEIYRTRNNYNKASFHAAKHDIMYMTV